MTTWFLLALVCGVAVASTENAAGEDLAVVTLTTANFDVIVKNTDFVLVEFFAPWCGHCKHLAPEFEKAAKALKSYGVVLAAVDATVEQELGQRFEVKGYPTLKFFRKGTPSNYEGGRTQSKIVKWVLSAISAPLKQLTTPDEVRAFNADGIAIVGFFSTGPETEILQAVSDADADLVYGRGNGELAKELSVPFPSLVLYQADGEKSVFEGPFTQESITAFIDRERFPAVIQFTMENARDIFQAKSGKIAFLFDPQPNSAFTEVANKFRGQLLFVSSDGSISRLNDHVGADSSKFPQLVLLKIKAGSNSLQRFPYSGELTAAGIEGHIAAFLDGSLLPTLKSEAPPADNSAPVKIVTGKTFQEIVLDPTKNVMLEVYAPWCGHCKTLAPIYEKLAEELASHSNIVVAKMDGTLNEVEGLEIRGFPTLKFYPAGANKQAQDYQGGRELEPLRSFLLEHSLAAKDTHQEL